jgi:hypothetical protein
VIVRPAERVGFEMSPIPQFWIVGDLRSPLVTSTGVSARAVQQVKKEGTNAVNAIVITPDLTTRRPLQQCRFERGLAVDTCEREIEVSLHRGARGRGKRVARAKMKRDRRNILRICLVWPRDLGRRPISRHRPTYQRVERDGGIGRPE